MPERLEGVKTLRPPRCEREPHDGVSLDEVDESQDEEPAVHQLGHRLLAYQARAVRATTRPRDW